METFVKIPPMAEGMPIVRAGRVMPDGSANVPPPAALVFTPGTLDVRVFDDAVRDAESLRAVERQQFDFNVKK